ncbi:cadmium resistance transporter [Streptomyces pseudovenezuelae]|uniref:cadmium resistance transporter n=1 Tax=Streptomyces pseudovenezuelae TaxID=67350 RepID=UPI00371C66B8
MFFAQSAGERGGARRIVLGQYLGFAAILVVAVAAAFGTTFLPEGAIPHLGLLPLVLGLKSVWRNWRARGDAERAGAFMVRWRPPRVTFANGRDSIGVCVPSSARRGGRRHEGVRGSVEGGVFGLQEG